MVEGHRRLERHSTRTTAHRRDRTRGTVPGPNPLFACAPELGHFAGGRYQPIATAFCGAVFFGAFARATHPERVDRWPPHSGGGAAPRKLATGNALEHEPPKTPTQPAGECLNICIVMF